MAELPPHLRISYQHPFCERPVQAFVNAAKAPGLNLTVEPCQSAGVFAGLQWLIPTAIVLWIGRSYFDGFVKEAGKDHYQRLKQCLNSWWPTFFGDSPEIRVSATGTPGRIGTEPASYSLAVSILGEADSGLQFKLLFPNSISAQDFNAATARFFDFLENFYSGTLDASTQRRLASARVVGRTLVMAYDPTHNLFVFLDPVPQCVRGR